MSWTNVTCRTGTRSTTRLKTATWKTGVGFTSGWETIGDGLLSSGPSCHKPLNAAGLDYTIICAGRGMKGDVWLVRLLK